MSIAQTSATGYGKRQRRTIEEWEQIVLTCLTSRITGKPNNWGCLSKQNELFRIATLCAIQVPGSVVISLCSKGLIRLNDAGFYEYIEPFKDEEIKVSEAGESFQQEIIEQPFTLRRHLPVEPPPKQEEQPFTLRRHIEKEVKPIEVKPVVSIFNRKRIM